MTRMLPRPLRAVPIAAAATPPPASAARSSASGRPGWRDGAGAVSGETVAHTRSWRILARMRSRICSASASSRPGSGTAALRVPAVWRIRVARPKLPLDRALGDVDMLDAAERHDGPDPDEQAVADVELVLLLAIAPGAVAALRQTGSGGQRRAGATVPAASPARHGSSRKRSEIEHGDRKEHGNRGDQAADSQHPDWFGMKRRHPSQRPPLDVRSADRPVLCCTPSVRSPFPLAAPW